MKTIDYKFIEFIPEQEDMEDGVIYISLDYDTAVHSCLCGCGHQVVTPLSPTDWKLTYNGESISLHPSIGNWEFDCKSHYWIREGKVIWDEMWSERRVHSGREKVRKENSLYYTKKLNEKKETWLHKLMVFLIRLFKE